MRAIWQTLCLVGVCGFAALPACGDDDGTPSGGTAGTKADAGEGGSGGSKAGGGEGGGAPLAGTGGVAEGGASGGAAPIIGGAAATCECTRDDNSAHVPLDCACAAGQCTTFEEDVEALPDNLGWPYYLLLGTCEGGYRRLVYAEALENGGDRTYDASGRMVYRSEGPYSVSVPEACGFEEPFDFGNLVIGDDPAEDCNYCLIAGEASGAGGAGGAPPYPELEMPPCEER